MKRKKAMAIVMVAAMTVTMLAVRWKDLRTSRTCKRIRHILQQRHPGKCRSGRAFCRLDMG